MLPQVSAKWLRVLAVTSDKRAAGLPEVPTVGEAGVPGYVVASWNALAAPVGNPTGRHRASARGRQGGADATRRAAAAAGAGRAAAGRHTEQLQALLTGEIRRWGEVIRAAKIEPE